MSDYDFRWKRARAIRRGRQVAFVGAAIVFVGMALVHAGARFLLEPLPLGVVLLAFAGFVVMMLRRT
jgi:hypothetical protein